MTNGIGSQGFFTGSGYSFIKKYDLNGDGSVTAEEFDAVNKAENNNSVNEDTNTNTENNTNTDKDNQNNQSSNESTTNDLPLDFTFGNMITDYDNGTVEDQTIYENQTDARKAFNNMKESYIESYIAQILESGQELSDAERKDLISFLNTKSAAFINQYFNKNPKGPYNIEEIASAYVENIQTLLQARNEKKAEVEEKMNAYKENSSASFEELLSLIDAADDEYITDSEYEAIIEQAMNYIIGAKLNGEDISVFLQKINPNNQNAQYYRQAMSYIDELMNTTDPEKQAMYLEYTETALKKYLGQKANDGSSAIVDAAYAQQKENQKQVATKDVDAVNDDRMEAYSQELEAMVESGEITKEEADAKLAEYEKKLNSIKNAYLNQDDYGSDVQKDYSAFIDRAEKEYEEVSKKIEEKSDTETTYQTLKEELEEAGLYANDEETEEIMNATKDFIVSAMLKGEESAILSAVMPRYTKNSNYKEAKALLEGLATSATPQADYEKAMQLIDEMVSELDADVDKIKAGVEAEETRRAEAQKAENKEKYTNTLTETIDEMVESYSTSKEISDIAKTDEDAAKSKIDLYEEKVNKALESFLAQYKGDGTEIEKEFKNYIANIESEYKEVKEEINEEINTNEELLQEIEDAGISISDKEQDEINKEAIDYIIDQITLKNGDTTLVENLYKGLSSNDKYKEAISLLENLESSITPKEDYEKAKTLLEEALNEVFNEDKIQDVAEVEESKNVNLKPGELTKDIWGYERNDTLGGDDKVYTNYTIQDGKIVWTNSDDKADIEKSISQLRERIQEQMKEQLGDLYNKEEIDRYIDQAVYNMALNLKDPMGLNTVKTLIDGIISEFNEIATAGLHGEETDVEENEGLNKSVILSNAGKIDDYNTGDVQTLNSFFQSYNNAIDDYRNNVSDRLNALKDSIVAEIKKQLGDSYVEADIQKLIEEVINSTINDCPKTDIEPDVLGIKFWNFQYNTQTMYDLFFDKLNAAFEEYKKSRNI